MEINSVRKHLSRIKGGRLAAKAAPATMVTLVISDVVGDDPSFIASGPGVGDQTTLHEARAILKKYQLTPPQSIEEALADPQNETLAPDDPVFKKVRTRIIANGALVLATAAPLLEAGGFQVINLGDVLAGEARDVGAEHAQLVHKYRQQKQPVALLSGGELTVTVRGDGAGGPSQEYALALVDALAKTDEGLEGIFAISADTDGCDGGEGLISDPAGALISPSTLSRASALKLNTATFLEHNDSGRFFETLGDLVKTGPTHTNVNDFRFILINKN
ncbi:MAG TPA: hypothetical protein DCO77_06140 [Nitrospiraceae bacterium]|nr:hypothetical protein [Nitrospiraceae bacterium]